MKRNCENCSKNFEMAYLEDRLCPFCFELQDGKQEDDLIVLEQTEGTNHFYPRNISKELRSKINEPTKKDSRK